MSNIGPTAEDVELFGQDLVDFTQRATAPGIDRRVAPLENQVARLQAELSQERVQRALDGDPVLGDKWRKLNNDPAFLAWLAETDELSGRPRLELLRRAYSLGDATRVAHFFRAFITRQIPTRTRTQHREPFEQTGRRPTLKAANLGDRRRTWTRPEIAAFYSDCRRGIYDQREPERLRIEAEILEAGRQGRVTGAPPRLYGEGQK